MRVARLGPFVLLWAAVGSAAAAQTSQGRLTGTVTDIQRAVLPGVTIVVTLAALIGQQSAVTQSDGRYLFQALPSGVYALTFTLPSFQVMVREGIELAVEPRLKTAILEGGGLYFEAGHADFPRRDEVRETLDWLDTYMGPVRR
jgi:hypothetical protein